ncbi:MAG: isoprenylcysteine carboxylmethyltransferase family protein [Firmicutes bacterium]|nr:isoprenylcysteine carboxylmethyltransferase family protein [Bacillota bacterium]
MLRELIGYALGFVLFILLIPFIMWKVSGPVAPRTAQIVAFGILAVAGIGISVWSIVYMKLVGKGNPMDAFNHEVAPRTSNLMTEGPYRLCRNPMLLGVFMYYLGILILLWNVKAGVIFVAFACIMAVQVKREESRLEAEFGDDYREYKKKTKRIIPFVW